MDFHHFWVRQFRVATILENQSEFDISHDFSDPTQLLHNKIIIPSTFKPVRMVHYMYICMCACWSHFYPRSPRKLFENFVYKLSGVWSVNFALISCRFEGVSARERGLNPRGVAYGAVTCLYSALAPSAAAAIAHIK